MSGPADLLESLPSSVETRHAPDCPTGYAAAVALVGEHDLATTAALAAALVPADGSVLCDLSRCSFIDSTVVGVLITSSKALARAGHRLDLVAPPAQRQVRRVIDVVGLGTILTILEELPTMPGPAALELDLASARESASAERSSRT